MVNTEISPAIIINLTLPYKLISILFHVHIKYGSEKRDSCYLLTNSTESYSLNINFTIKESIYNLKS